MGHATSHPADADHGHSHGGGHAHVEVETPEMKAEREQAEAVQAAMSHSLSRRVAPLLIIGGAGVSLALLSTLGADAEPQAWLWLLPAFLVTAWGLSLRT